MIVKPYEAGSRTRDPRERAGAAAEQQMAHYLHRKFHRHPDVCVLHQLRIEDAEQLDQGGGAGVCQIDHLVVHRWGFFLVESKSVTEAVGIRSDGDGGDEWTRTYRGEEQGIPSPIRQAERQSEFLRTVLQRHRTELVGRLPFGLRTVARILWQSDRRGFGNAPMQLAIAISDEGRISRSDGWKAPVKPFRMFVAKADLVPDKINEELDRHRAGANPLHVRPVGDYGLWSMDVDEVRRVAEFLASRHVATTAQSTTRAARPHAAVERRGFSRIRKRYPNAYQPWTAEDGRELCQLRDDGWEVAELAERFGRQPGAIRSRLRKLGRG